MAPGDYRHSSVMNLRCRRAQRTDGNVRLQSKSGNSNQGVAGLFYVQAFLAQSRVQGYTATWPSGNCHSPTISNYACGGVGKDGVGGSYISRSCGHAIAHSFD